MKKNKKKLIDLRNIKYHVQPTFKWLFLPEHVKEALRILTGGRGGGKTTAVVQSFIKESFTDGDNFLVIRGTKNSHRDTTFQEFKDWISIFGLDKHFQIRESTMLIKNTHTKAKIYFRGCDNINKIKGTKRVKKLLIDEANVGVTEPDFRTIKFSMRGMKRIEYYLCYNPINPHSCPWKKYIDDPVKYKCFHHHSTYLTNPFNGDQYIEEFEDLKKLNYKQYKVEGLGEYGVYEGAILDNDKIVKISNKDFEKMGVSSRKSVYQGLGIDFGVEHPMTFSHTLYDKKTNSLFIKLSIGESGLTTRKFIKKHMTEFKELQKLIKNKYADAADKGGRIELKEAKWDFKPSYKENMELAFIQWFNNLNACYIIDDNCKGFQANAESWIWKNGKPQDINDDYIDSVRYSLEPIIKATLNVRNKIEHTSHGLYI